MAKLLSIRVKCLFIQQIDQKLSDWHHVNGSVPHRSWLGPLHFVIMMNGLQAGGGGVFAQKHG